MAGQQVVRRTVYIILTAASRFRIVIAISEPALLPCISVSGVLRHRRHASGCPVILNLGLTEPIPSRNEVSVRIVLILGQAGDAVIPARMPVKDTGQVVSGVVEGVACFCHGIIDTTQPV